MTRLSREDLPGSWHHVMNRGIARRTMFERRPDMRAFSSLLACRVRAGEIELHAFCLMGTHYHLLVRSPAGRLAGAMQRVQLGYSRYFNRGRRRDGSLVRARYWSKPVKSERYRRHLVAYIDANSVKARLVSDPAEYPYGSAYYYSRKGLERRPQWLDRTWVEDVVRCATQNSEYSHLDYRRVFRCSQSPSLDRIVESRIASRSQSDPLDDLVSSSPKRIAEWMRRKAELADGTAPGMPVCDPGDVDALVERFAVNVIWKVGSSASRNGWEVARAGLWIELCASTQSVIAQRMGCSDTTVGKLYELHQRLIAQDALYSERVGRIASEALGVWGVVGG